ncbi:MAG: hypothetical protein ACOY3P_07625 [Planctomycetota bacterium]
MSSNPFQSPQADLGPHILAGDSVERLRNIALYQKAIVFCVLAEIVLYVALFMLPAIQTSGPGSSIFVGLVAILVVLLSILVVVAAVVFVALLATQLYNLAVGIICAVLTVVPCVGLLVLLILSQKATNVLKQHGYSVGLLGARMSQFSR